MSAPEEVAALAAELRIPTDEEGPVFAEPWQAQVFALTIGLHRAGRFTWKEWTEYFGRELAEAGLATGAPVTQSYYRCWLEALEHLVHDKSLAGFTELRARSEDIAANPPGHDHEAKRAPVRVA